MESRKTVLMSLFAGQEWGCRHRERACGHSRGGRGWDGLSELRWHIDTTRCKTVSSVGSFYAAQGAHPDALGRPRGWDWGGRLQGGRGTHTHTSHLCTYMCAYDWLVSNTALQSNLPPIQNQRGAAVWRDTIWKGVCLVQNSQVFMTQVGCVCPSVLPHFWRNYSFLKDVTVLEKNQTFPC